MPRAAYIARINLGQPTHYLYHYLVDTENQRMDGHEWKPVPLLG